MAYIKDVQVGSDTYLIEPALYIAPSKNGAAYTATLTNFSLVTGATVQAKFAATNDANATLNVNSTGAKEIHYNGAKITASQFKVNHVYTLVYDGTQWQVVGDIDTNTTYSLSGLGGIGTISASGTAPLTLSGSKSGTTYTLTGSVADASFTTSGIVNTSAQVFGGGKTLRFTSRIYPLIGTSAERSQWYKITFPYSTITTGSSAQWFMNSFDLHFGGGYSANPSGVAHVTFYWTRAANNGSWAVGQQAALIEGILANKIGLYYRIAEPGVLYVNNTANTYNGIWIDNLYVDDTAINLNWSTITITTTAAITESTSPKLSDYTKITTSYLYNDGGTLKTDSNFEGKYIKGTWLYTSAATAKTSTSKLATIESDNFIYYITPANALKSAVGTTAIGAAATPIYWDGSKFAAGDVLKNLAYKDSLVASDIPDISGTYLKLAGGTMSGVIKSSYKSGTWVNSLTNSALTLEDQTGSFGSWISGPTKDGRIAIATYQGNDNKLYIGYGERGRTANSYAKSLTWNGTDGTLTADKFSGTAALTGTPTAPTAADGTNTTQIATTAFVMSQFKYNDAMIYKGVVNANSDLPATHYQGWTYKVGTAGTYAGIACEIGDMIICNTDGTSANNAHWNVIQTNIDGAVIGPSSSTDGNIVLFDGNTGRIIKNSSYSPSSFATSGHNHNSTYLKLDGSNNMTADVNIIAGDTDKFINFWYNTGKAAGASWRIGMLGSGSSDTNYFAIQSGTSTTSATTWNNVLRIGQNTYDAGFGGNVYPLTNNNKTLGTSSLKWNNVYATTFTGNLTGNATSADSAKWLMNRGGSTVTISDGPWAHGQTGSGGTNAATVWHQRWKQSGLTYTPSGGSATTLTDSGDMVLWLAQATTSNTLTVNMAIDGIIYALGGFKGNLNGQASTVARATFGDSGNGEHNANNIKSNGLWYYTSNGPATALGASTGDGAIYSQAYSTSWAGQIAQDYRDGALFVRGLNSGTWKNWYAIPKFTTTTGGLGSATQPVYIDTNGELQACTAYGSASVASAGKWTTARNISISDSDGTNTGTAVSVDGSAAATLKLPATIKAWIGKGTHTAAPTANEFTPAVGTMTVVGNVSNTTMAHSNNANAEIIIKAHPTSGTNYFEARLGFSSNGSIYHMPVNTTTWERILTETNTYAGTNATASMTWGGTYTLARINGTDIKITMPGNPNTDHYAWADITSKPETATRWPTWSEVTGKPSTFTPSAHEHNYIGNTRFISYPSDGHYEGSGSVTGYIKIKIPQTKSATMLSFDVDIYNYSNDTTVRYHIAGYNYVDASWNNTTAYCIAPLNNNKANLPVRFLSNGNDEMYVTIGNTDTTWSYPKVTVHNIVMGHSGNTLANWSSGWTITLVNTAFDDSLVKVTKTNTNIAYKATAANFSSTKFGIAYYSDTSGTFSGTGTGTSGQYLKSNGNSAPTWASFGTTLSSYGITNAVQYNGIDNDIGSSATAANAKSYWANNNKVPKGKVVFNYNSSGTEFTTLFSNNNNTYGSILKWGYQDTYIRILRAHPGQTAHNGWYTEDWEKINAGYADSAGTATSAGKWTTARTLTIGNKGQSVDGSGNVSWSLADIGAAPAVTGGYLPLSGGTMTGRLNAQKGFSNLLTGTGTAGVNNSGTYTPVKWTFNAGVTVADGDRFTVKIPNITNADWGVFMSVNNGTNYYPVGLNGTGRLTTHYPVNTYIDLVFEASGQVNSVFPLAGGTARVNVTGGCWRVLNYYVDGNPGDWNLRQYNIIAAVAITGGNIIAATDSGYRHLKDNVAFDIRYPILYAGSNIGAGAAGSNNYLHHYAIGIRTTQPNATFTAYKPLFIEGTLSGNTFTPISATPLTQTIPTSDNGHVYYYIGRMYNATDLTFDTTARAIFWYKNGVFQPYGGAASYAVTAATASSVAWTNVSSRPTKITLTGAVTGSVSLGAGDLSLATSVNHTHSYAGSSTAGGAATNAVTTANTSDSIYPVGVKSGATTTLLHDTSITMKGGAISATTYTVNSHVTLQYNTTDSSLDFIFT